MMREVLQTENLEIEGYEEWEKEDVPLMGRTETAIICY